jgi:putative ABC transport system ATP-binding protein
MGIIRIEGLKKVYDTGLIKFEALKGVDFSIEKGEFVAIMGQSGSGKSTLMNIIGCLDVATEGKYFLGGNDISMYKENELNKVRNTEIGFVFQSFNLLPKLNVLKNVELPMVYGGVKQAERKERAMKFLEMVGLGDKWKNRPNELSGGQKQRVAIARALTNNPKILLADEPTGNLDSQSEKEIMEIFKKLNEEGTPIIMVTHEPEIAHYASRVIHFRDGHILYDEKKRVDV